MAVCLSLPNGNGNIRIRPRVRGPSVSVSVQRLDLQRNGGEDEEPVRGQIVISLISRDRGGSHGPAVTDATGISTTILSELNNELPEG